jgi:hypothetical protein
MKEREDSIKTNINLNKQDMRFLNGFNWLEVVFSGKFSRIRQWVKT